MNTKKIISLLLALVFMLSCSLPVLAVEYKAPVETNIMQPRFANIESLSVNIKKVGSGVVGVASGSVKGGYTGKIFIYLQRSANETTWQTIESDYINLAVDGSGGININDDSLETGYYYRIKASICVYSNGSEIERTSAVSKSIYF